MKSKELYKFKKLLPAGKLPAVRIVNPVTVCCYGLLLLVMLTIIPGCQSFIADGKEAVLMEEQSTNLPPKQTEKPLIDQKVPDQLETATFAMG